MIKNSSSPNAKPPHTDAGGVAGPGGDVRKEGNYQIKLQQQEHDHYLHDHIQQQQTEGDDMLVLPSPFYLPESACR